MDAQISLAERYEETPWGLQPHDQAEYTTLSDNLMTPFIEIIRILRTKPKKKQGAVEPDMASADTPDLTT